MQRISINLIFLTFALATTCSNGDVIWVRGNPEPVYGFILSQTEDVILFREFQNDSLSEAKSISRTNVEQLVANIDRSKLEMLDPSRPIEYRDYAEILASQSADPVAKQMARRLFLIAAANSTSPEIRSSALAGLANLANSEQERKRLEVLKSLERKVSFGSVRPTQNPDRQLLSEPSSKLLLDLIRAIRTEDSVRSAAILASRSNRQLLAEFNQTISLEELDAIAKLLRPTSAQLCKLVRLEAPLMRTKSEETPGTKIYGQGNWGEIAMQVSNNLEVLPTFENVINIDPRKSIFRDGNWITPPKTSDATLSD